MDQVVQQFEAHHAVPIWVPPKVPTEQEPLRIRGLRNALWPNGQIHYYACLCGAKESLRPISEGRWEWIRRALKARARRIRQ